MKKIFSIIALLFSLISDAQQIAPGSKSGDTLLYTGFSRFRDIATTTDTTTKKPMGLDANGLSYRMSYWPGSGVSGVTTMTAFGSTPNANGGTISGVNLTLQPADGSFGGGVSTTTQRPP